MKQVQILDLKPIAKPRQTRSDKWKQRPSVVAYRAFADELRRQFGEVPDDVVELSVTFFIQVPDSWSEKRKKQHVGQYHQQTPDIDNLLKAVMDALLPDGDHRIAHVHAMKMWATYNAIDIEME